MLSLSGFELYSRWVLLTVYKHAQLWRFVKKEIKHYGIP